jgi:DNA-binding GntR family transcriptional regulator
MVELIRLMILRGEVGLGGRMVEVELSETLRAGRSTVREALRRLEGEGLLLADDSGGMRVIRIHQRELVATLQVRAALEALSSGLAAGRVKEGRTAPADLHRLDVLAEAAASASPTQERETAILADRHFHRAIAALGANQPCRDALDHVWDRIVMATVHSVWRSGRVAVADHEHRELLDAIAAGDEDQASAIARRHVLADLT